MDRTSLSLIGAWIVIVLVGLSSISYYHQQYFEEQLEKNMDEIEEKMENELTELEEKWENLDKTDPREISHYFQFETFPYSYAYDFDFHEYLQTLEKGSILTGTFTTQANEGTLLEGILIIRLAFSSAVGELYSTSECGKTFLDHSQKYEDNNQAFSWDEFKDSDEFGEFLDEFHHVLENKEEITLQEAYQQIEDLKKADILKNPYRKALLQSYVYLAETGYNNYQMHKNQHDFIKALADAEVVYSVYGFSRHLYTKEIAFTTLMPFRRGMIFVHSSILDLVAVLSLSTFIITVAWLIMRKKSS